MKTPFHKASLLAAVAFTALAFAPSMAQAQTEPVTATVEVLNTITLNEVDPLDFGIVAAISDAANTANLAIDAATGVLTPTTTGGTAVFAVIDNTTASQALIEVSDAANGASLVIEINNVVNPIFGGNAFDLTDWETNWNAGAVTARTVATPFNYTFLAATGPNLNELRIGASVETQTAVALYADGIYTGSFDVVFSY